MSGKPRNNNKPRNIKLSDGRIVRVIPQEPYQNEVEIEGQKVALPFTNGRLKTALIKQTNGKWAYLFRQSFSDPTFDRQLKSLIKALEEPENEVRL